MKILNNPALFLKGTCEVTVKRPADGQIVFQSSLVSTNSFTTEVDMSPIRAGLGNTIAIQLPSDSAVNLELTTADFSMQARAMQIGTEVAFNAIAQKCATVTAESAALTIPDSVTEIGSNVIYLYEELYHTENGYEVHMMLTGRRDLRYLTIVCEEIEVQTIEIYPGQ